MKARVIAHYLPQYHPIPENDAWWGRGFTEWTNVAKARPLFFGHYQPHLPSDLGFYDLRVPETREQQANLARDAGIEAFCYWHYWFEGRRILERPFAEVVESGKPDFPFCLAWANESWRGVWHGCERRTLVEQTYGGPLDNDAHFYTLLPAFRDRRYLRVDGRLLFIIYRPASMPEASRFMQQWNTLARMNGVPQFYFLAHTLFSDPPLDWRTAGFDGAILAHSLKIIRMRAWDVIMGHSRQHDGPDGEPIGITSRLTDAATAAIRLGYMRTLQRILGWPGSLFEYSDACLFTSPRGRCPDGCFPTAISNWDNSPRSGRKGVIFHDSTPEKFRTHLRQVLATIRDRPFEQRLVFLKSWNEWAEGNYVEPDRRFGRGYLNVIRGEII